MEWKARTVISQRGPERCPEIETACDAVTQVLTRHLAELQNETTVLLRRVGGARRRQRGRVAMPDAVAKTLDNKGDLCPLPVVKSSKAIKELNDVQVLEVLATDPAAKPDFAAWSKTTGHKLLSSSEDAGPSP
jgi:TusA-related sulfurtransferase